MSGFIYDSESLRQIGHVAEELGKLNERLPAWLYLDTNINILIEDGDGFASIGVLKPSEVGEGYDFEPFATPRKAVK